MADEIPEGGLTKDKLRQILEAALEALRVSDSTTAVGAVEDALNTLDPPREYEVSWSVDVMARTPREAALKAQTMQRDYNSIASFFGVTDAKAKRHFVVDLSEDTVSEVST